MKYKTFKLTQPVAQLEAYEIPVASVAARHILNITLSHSRVYGVNLSEYKLSGPNYLTHCEKVLDLSQLVLFEDLDHNKAHWVLFSVLPMRHFKQ